MCLGETRAGPERFRMAAQSARRIRARRPRRSRRARSLRCRACCAEQPGDRGADRADRGARRAFISHASVQSARRAADDAGEMTVLDDDPLQEACAKPGHGWVAPSVPPNTDHDLIDFLLSAQEPGVLTMVVLSGTLPAEPNSPAFGEVLPCVRLAMRLTLSSLAELCPSANALWGAAANMPVAFDRSSSQVSWVVSRARNIDRQARLTETSSLLESIALSLNLPCEDCAASASTSSATTRSTLFFDAISDTAEGHANGTAAELCNALSVALRTTLLPAFPCFHLSSVFKLRVFHGESVENPAAATRALRAIGVDGGTRGAPVQAATLLL